MIFLARLREFSFLEILGLFLLSFLRQIGFIIAAPSRLEERRTNVVVASVNLPNWWLLTIFGILIGASFLSISWLCCIKKRSSSYGSSSKTNVVQIYRLKPSEVSSEIPQSSTAPSSAQPVRVTINDGRIPFSYQTTPEELTKTSTVTRTESAKLLTVRITNGSPSSVRRSISKEDISPPMISEQKSSSTLVQGSVYKSSSPSPSPTPRPASPFSNPDPTKDPLKPFTYSPIPPVRPGRTKNASGSANRGSPDLRGENSKDSSGKLPFSNPDPLKEPLKPFTYSPIPVKPDAAENA